jgi:hypothetical protein
LLERAECESPWLFCPEFADVLIRREAFECLEPSGEIVGCDEIGEMGSQLIVGLIEVAFDGRILDNSVHVMRFSNNHVIRIVEVTVEFHDFNHASWLMVCSAVTI